MATQTVRAFSVLCGVVIVAGISFARDTVSLNDNDGVTARIVADMVQSRHIAHPQIDNALSTRLLNRYVEAWDPQKLYFLKSDIDEFSQSASKLDDSIQAGNVEFATQVFGRVRERMYDRADKIAALIDAEHDFSADEEMITDPDERDWGRICRVTRRTLASANQI